ERLHEHASLEVDDAQPRARSRRKHGVAASRRLARIVGRPELARIGPLEIPVDLPLRPGVVAAGEQIERLEQLVGRVAGDPRAAFSELPTHRSSACRSRNAGTKCFTAARPGFPTMSPTKRTFMGSGAWPPCRSPEPAGHGRPPAPKAQAEIRRPVRPRKPGT